MVKIYTVSYSRPDFIHLQFQQFQKYLEDEYSFTILNNAKDNREKQNISDACNQLGLECIVIDNTGYRADAAGLPALNYCIKNLVSKENPENVSVIIDSDVFLFKPFSFLKMAEGFDICTIYQQRVKTSFKFIKKNIGYCWIAFLVLNHKHQNFNSLSLDAIIGLTDLGGASYYFLDKNNPSVKWVSHTADMEESGKVVFNEELVGSYNKQFGFQVIHNAFIHYYRGSNWDGMNSDYHIEKTKFLERVLNVGASAINEQELSKLSSIFEHTNTHFDGVRYKAMPWYYKPVILKQLKKFSRRKKTLN
jgi:hypothetical protein